MAARHADLFTVSSASDIEELERVLSEETPDSSGSITIDIPDGATTFFNARDFRRLLLAARASDTELQVRTDDPLRRELARIIGIPVTPVGRANVDNEVYPDDATRRVSPAVPEAAPESCDEAGTRVDAVPSTLQEATDEATTRASVLPELPGTDSATPAVLLEESEASFSFVITPPVPRRPFIASDRPSTLNGAAVERGHVHARPHAGPRGGERTSLTSRSRRRLIGVLVIIASLIALAAFAFGFVMPSATLTVTPRVTPIETSLTYGLDTPGATWDVRIAPSDISTTVTFSASSPATGERFEPDATATGAVLLTNATTVDVIVPTETVLTTIDGVDVVTTEEIVVPAADPFGSLTFGSAEIAVRASAPGPSGNLGAETIYGQLDNGLFFTNREPLTGGTNRRIVVVSQADIDALQQQARDDLQAQAAVALPAALQPGQRLVAGSERRGSIQLSFDRQVGEDATEVRIDASMSVSGQAFNPEEWHQQARKDVESRMQALVGKGQLLIDGSVAVADPAEVPGAGGTAYIVGASARVRSAIDMERLDATRVELRGQSADDAVARIQQIEGVQAVSVEQDNDWLWKNLPQLTSRITIEVVDAERQGVSP